LRIYTKKIKDNHRKDEKEESKNRSLKLQKSERNLNKFSGIYFLHHLFL